MIWYENQPLRMGLAVHPTLGIIPPQGDLSPSDPTRRVQPQWPPRVECVLGTQQTVHTPFMRHSLTCRSSAPETMRGRVGWKLAQLTPLSCPSSTYLTWASPLPNRSAFTCQHSGVSSEPRVWGLGVTP